MKRCFVTGATGFIGANLARRLLREGHEVHILARANGRRWRLKEIASSVQIHPGDFGDEPGLRKIVQRVQPEWVFHLAAYGGSAAQTAMETMLQVNVKGSAAFLDACLETGVEAYVHAGTSSEYGFKPHPAREEERLEPNSLYAVTKAAATHYCQWRAKTSGLNAAIARLYSVYGPYEEPSRLIPTLVARGLRGELPPLASAASAHDFVYIDDAVDALVHLARADHKPGAVYNVCTGRQTTLARVVETARQSMGIAAMPVWDSMPRRSWDSSSWCGSPDLMAAEIGWRAQIGFATGFERVVDWFLANPRWRRFYDERCFPERRGNEDNLECVLEDS